MVAVAQLVESRIVIPVVVGSSPISHPIYIIPKYLYLCDSEFGFLRPKFTAYVFLLCIPSVQL